MSTEKRKAISRKGGIAKAQRVADFCGRCGASIPPRVGESTCADGCVPHVVSGATG